MMTATTKLLTVETKIFLREPAAWFWGLSFPALLLLVLGFAFPGGREPNPDLGGARLVDVYAPIVLALGLITLGLATLPAVLATYREFGILRRMSVTPVHPRKLLIAQLGVHGGAAVVGSAVAILAGVLVFDIPLPAQIGWFVLSFLLATTAMFALGLLVGAVAKTVSSGQGLGMALYFPMLFFAGVYFPREVMPDGLRRISDLTPAGAGVQAIQDAWGGTTPAISNLAVMAIFTVVVGLIAARVFRWE